jgi:hypothetical protein
MKRGRHGARKMVNGRGVRRRVCGEVSRQAYFV